ncbi:uncharacterized protein LOC127248682 [Andrographis paniculata]|uniref:uncharacterized protein LOC127248682 n=1 Tax=Andrographis paniculata TaxID=175694 RepID=UPI0021E999FC|nr:uncharacterized protein LOC127248682 [Andrographis paniculata]
MASSSSSASTHFNPENQKSYRPPPAYRSALHAVRKLPGGKNVITKKPIAPMPPTPPKIYKVNPVDFRDVVQRLTGAIELRPTRLREVAPPPLSLSPRQEIIMTQRNNNNNNILGFDGGNYGAISPTLFSLSPSSMAWCSSILMSPGALSS